METQEEIYDESDHEDKSIGYYTRSKRRKLNKIDEESGSVIGENLERKRKNPIMFMPTEVLRMIFKKLSHHELSQTVRLVNRRFKIIAEDVLNTSFSRLDKRVETLLKTTEFSLAYTQDDMEIRCVSKLLNLLEIIQLQLKVLYATVWRYIYNEFYRTTRSCMYAGQLIDVFQAFMWKFTHCPSSLYAVSILKDYSLPNDVTKILQLTKIFCIHFDKVSEEPMKNCLINSGCKMIDIIDSAKFVEKKINWETYTKDNFTAQYSYFFRNSWFVALPIVSTKEMEWPQKQRMMHMRLRRIVVAHNDMFLTQAQYERELVLRPTPERVLKKPGNNVYTGYGDGGDLFFYYGVMNEGAYIQKFNIEDDNDESDLDEELLNENPGQNLQRNNSEEEILYRVSHIGFRLTVTVQCPLPFAPLKFLEKLTYEKQEKIRRKYKLKDFTCININFECLGATYPRLPTFYRYDFWPNCF